MLYIIKSGKYIKVGFTENEKTWKTRLDAYYTSNPDFSVIKLLPGGREQESWFHLQMKEYHYRREWFLNPPIDTLIDIYTSRLSNNLLTVSLERLEHIGSYASIYKKLKNNKYITDEEKNNESYKILVEYYSYFGKFEPQKSKAIEQINSYKNLISTEVVEYVKSVFISGHRYSRKEVKNSLNDIYLKFGITKKATYKDLEKYGIKYREVTVKGVRYIEISS